jgi:hypothetical protein
MLNMKYLVISVINGATAVLGTSQIIRKVLQCEAWSLSVGVHHWLGVSHWFLRSIRRKETCDK